MIQAGSYEMPAAAAGRPLGEVDNAVGIVRGMTKKALDLQKALASTRSRVMGINETALASDGKNQPEPVRSSLEELRYQLAKLDAAMNEIGIVSEHLAQL